MVDTNTAKESQASFYKIEPLLSFQAQDLIPAINSVNQQLSILNKNASSLSGSVPVNGILFASVSAADVLLDKLVTDKPSTDYSGLAIDLIGCLSGEDAIVASQFRPILHKTRDAFLRLNGGETENPLKASDLALFQHHINSTNAGELETFASLAQSKLPELLNKASALADDILTSLTVSSTATTIAQPALSGWLDPKKTYLNIWQALASITQPVTEPAAENTNLDESTNNISKINKFKNTLTKELTSQAGTQKEQIGFYLQKLQEAIIANPSEKTGVIVEGEAAQVKEQKKDGIIEALSQVGAAQGCANSCEGNCSTYVGGSIGVALGEEFLTQTDFTLSGILPLIWDRVYRSNLITYTKSELGARWINRYISRIDIRSNEWLFNTADGRMLKLPKLNIGDAHRHNVDGFNIIYLSEELISITYGKNMLELFEKHGNSYKLATIKDQNNNTISLSYDDHHRLILINNHSNNYSLTFDYTSNNYIQKVHLNKNHRLLHTIVEYEYDKRGDLTSVIDGEGEKRTFEYDNYHRITRYVDRTGFSKNLKWSGKRHYARCIEEYADDGSHALKLSWNDKLRATTVANALGQNIIFFYDLDGYPTRTIYPDHREEWFFRDAKKNITKHISLNGRTTIFHYDEKNNLISQTLNDDGTIYFQYNEHNQLIKTIDQHGHVWRNQYDTKGNIIKFIDPKEQTTSFEYNEQNLPVKVTDAKGGVKTFEYSTTGLLLKQTDCSQKSTEYSYDEQGRLITIRNAQNQSIKYQYTPKGKLQAITNVDGKKTQYRYDAEGRPLSASDSSGNSVLIEYNSSKTPTIITDSLGRKLHNKRNIIGLPIEFVDANDSSYQWQYDQYNRLVKETNFAGKNTYYEYNKKTGELLKSKEDGGETIHYTYDSLGRIVKRSTKNQSENYLYDKMGRLIQSQNAYSKLQYFYDSVGNLSKEIQNITQISKSGESKKNTKLYIWRHEYDSIGNRISTIDPEGQRIDYMVYGSGHIHGVLLNQQPLIDYERNNLHQEIQRQYGNNIQQQYQFDAAGRVKQQLLSGNLNIRKDFQYNEQGLLSQIQNSHNGTKQYQYDIVGRLINAKTPHFTEQFQFDYANNPIDPFISLNKLKDNANSLTHYDKHKELAWNFDQKIKGNLIKNHTGKHYEYDQRGNLIKKINNGQISNYKWDDFNHLIQLINSKGTTHYRYDVEGRRVYKRHPNQSETYYLWQGNTLTHEIHSSGYKRSYIYEPRSFIPLAQVTQKPETNNKQVFYYHNDHIGTPELITNESGEIIWEGRAKAFGETHEIVSAKAKLDHFSNPLRFQGQYYDDESELHYNLHRYYDPEIGRYISEDPIKLSGGTNLYNYPMNPIHARDPLGLVEWTGTAYYVSVGPASGVHYELHTKCINGQRGSATVWVKGGTYGRGLALGAAGTRVTFEDGLDHIDPNVFNGVYAEASAGISLFKGINISTTQLGGAKSQGIFGTYYRGHTASAGYSGGIATVTNPRIESCRPERVLTPAERAENERQAREGAAIYEEMKRNGQIPPTPNINFNNMRW